MTRDSFLQKPLLVTLAITSLLVVGGFALSISVLQYRYDESKLNPISFFASVIQNMSATMPPEKAILLLKDPRPQNPRSIVYILDQTGSVIGSNIPESSFTPPLIPKNLLPQEDMVIHRLNDPHILSFASSILKLPGTPVRYLVFRHGPSGFIGAAMPTIVGFVVMSALLSTLLSFGFLLYYFRRNTQVVKDVMSQIHSGNLKARLPIRRLDEVGQVMTQFNSMADEIEELVCRVRNTEAVRIQILQELGHDLRTPLASLRNMQETLIRSKDHISDEQRSELTSTSLEEILYLSQLVEDLLFLARVEDPRYLKQGDNVPLEKMLDSEVERLRISPLATGKRMTLESQLPANFEFFADTHLLRRLLRNALDNALSLARSRVTVRSFLGDKQDVVIEISDDGPGFPSEVLNSFGEKRMRRSVRGETSHRISLGLGSVIMKAVVAAHQGNLQISNTKFGAQVQIHLPIRI